MPLIVAIVGRPNVGKSTLFNRLIGKRLALVDDEPGVTRDRREGDAKLRDLHFTIIDTAGLEESGPKTLSGRMRAQTETAIADADIVLFVIDARMGPTHADQSFAELVRRSDKPVILLANKAEGKAGREGAIEAYSLGLGEPVSISAEHGEGMPELYDALRVHAPRDEDEADDEDDEDDGRDIGRDDEEAEALPPIIRVAVIGRPNAGKSTMINRLLGEERLLTGPEAGITRDSIAVEVEHDGITFRIFDTAGIRRRARVEEKLEKLSVADALNAVRFAEVVVLMMDAERPFEDQDLKLADLIEREGRALVLAMNKWDLVEHKPGSIGKLREEADHWLPQVKGVPIVAISGLRNEGLDRLLKAVVDIRNVWNKRVPTTPLNRWLEETLSSHPPPAVSGRRLKFNYMTQAKARPPSFVLFCTRADAVPEGYKRYLVNGLREAFDLIGTPIRLTLREKKNPYADRERRHR